MFSFKRFFEQFKMIWMQNAQKQGLVLAVLTLVIIYINFNRYYFDGNSSDLAFLGMFVAVMTIINSTNVFSALLHTSSGIHYYMTPASISEKYLAAWFYSSIITIAVYTLTIYFVNLASISVGNAITGQEHSFVIPIETLKEGFLDLMFVQSLFFLGAVVFKKNPLGKTLLTIICCGFIISLISALIIRWYLMGEEGFSNLSDTTNYNLTIHIDNINDLNLPENLGNLKEVLKVIVFCIPFVCWITAYFRLKKREI